MRKVNNLQLSTIEKQMAFYDFSSFDAENRVVIYFGRDQFSLADPGSVSYTHLTLPTKLEV